MKPFDPRKALNALLYVAARLGAPADVYASLKAIYFADIGHLQGFGRTMFGESYSALEHGPVPSRTYDLVKFVRGQTHYASAFPGAAEALSADKYNLHVKRQADLDVFSRSELIALDKGIEAVRGKTFKQIKRLSHDAAWREADANGEMSLESIAKMLDDSADLLQHLKDRFPGQVEAA